MSISRKAPLSNIGHFPLQNITIKTDLEKDIYGELKRSWDAYEAIDEFEIVNKDTEVRSIISAKQHEVNQVECEIRELVVIFILNCRDPRNICDRILFVPIHKFHKVPINAENNQLFNHLITK